MKKTLLLTIVAVLAFSLSYSQTDKLWLSTAKKEGITVSKNTERASFPTEFKLFQLNLASFTQALSKGNAQGKSNTGIIISVPNANGGMENFRIIENSNFTSELQAQYPEIRSYSGIGIDDKFAQIRLSADPNGIQAMIFRTDRQNEFIEPYSTDGKTYAVFNSSRNKGNLPFTCSTPDQALMKGLAEKAPTSTLSNTGELLTFRLALSCNGQYANYFGATSAANAALVVAAFNATMTRVNGVFEKDLSIHMNLIANTTSVIYYNGSTDPYSNNMNNWNGELQSTLTSVIGEANYDIGHMFGRSGGGGNAGCIGCVCVNGQKGSGITSPADGVPAGDNFDIDYVTHEMGHQFGGNHTYSYAVEGTGVNVEVGSGSTIMGYAGITPYDVQSHSDDYFTYATIKQIQDNMAGKTCPIRTPLTNIAPIVDAGADYTIPKSTPFMLTGVASDPNNDPITYCWEQNDSPVAQNQTGSGSAASATKTGGPNWRSYDPVSSPTRYFPPLARVLANQSTTQGLDINTEALSSVSRTLNFTLTCRDNIEGGGQTNTDAMVVTVNAAAGPFLVTFPNASVSLAGGSNQTITWDVAGTTANGVNAAYVDIMLSTDGGNTYPVVLASKVPNDGSETITLPNTPGTQNRIMIKGYNHIFYDLSNANFTITAAPSTFAVAFSGTSGDQNRSACSGSPISYIIKYNALAGFSGITTFSATGNPAGTTVTFSPATMSASGDVTMTISNNTVPGFYPLVVTATSGAVSKTVPFYFELLNSEFGTMTLTAPANAATAQNTELNLSWAANNNASSYDVQLATDENFTTIITSVTTAATSTTISGLQESTDYFWRVLPKNISCSGTYSITYKFTTGIMNCATTTSTNVPVTISAGAPSTINSFIEIPNSYLISNVKVIINANHSYISDLTATLISPTGIEIPLFTNACGDSDNINATFSDEGTILTCGTSPAISGIIRPQQPLSVLNSQNAQGTWTLRIRDAFNGDGGALNSWGLTFCTADVLDVKQETFTHFSVYPNPNTGNFNVQFTNNSSENDIKISVFDIRGRMIFEKEYTNQSVFNENIQLNNIQAGVYLLNVSNGETKEVKRIIIK